MSQNSLNHPGGPGGGKADGTKLSSIFHCPVEKLKGISTNRPLGLRAVCWGSVANPRNAEPRLGDLLHEEVSWATQRIVRILVHGRSRIFWWIGQPTGDRIRIKVAVNRMEWQIAVAVAMSVVTTLRRWARIAVLSMHHVSAWPHGGLAHGTSIPHDRAGTP